MELIHQKQEELHHLTMLLQPLKRYGRCDIALNLYGMFYSSNVEGLSQPFSQCLVAPQDDGGALPPSGQHKKLVKTRRQRNTAGSAMASSEFDSERQSGPDSEGRMKIQGTNAALLRQHFLDALREQHRQIKCSDRLASIRERNE